MFFQKEIPETFLSLRAENYTLSSEATINTPGGSVQKVVFQLLAISIERSMFPSYRPGEVAKPLCASRDGIQPSHGTAQRSGPCETCQESQWIKQSGKNFPPPCSLVYVIWGLDNTNEIFFRFRCKKSAIPPLRRFLASAQIALETEGKKFIVAAMEVQKAQSTLNYCVPVFSILSEQADEGKCARLAQWIAQAGHQSQVAQESGEESESQNDEPPF